MDRDQRVGQGSFVAGETTIRFNNMIPETNYVFCAYLENRMKVLSGAYCKVFMTQAWGEMKVMKIKFSKTISDF
jgi:hypothetical protein